MSETEASMKMIQDEGCHEFDIDHPAVEAAVEALFGHHPERGGQERRQAVFAVLQAALPFFQSGGQLRSQVPKVQVPRRTAQEVEAVAAEMSDAIECLRRASDKIRPYSARIQFKAADLAEQATALRGQVLELGGALEVVDA